MRLLLTALLAAIAQSFVTISQSRFGAQLHHIKDLMHVADNHTDGPIPWKWPSGHVPDQRAATHASRARARLR